MSDEIINVPTVWYIILSIIGACAWIPIIFNFILNIFRKIHCVYLDNRIIRNVLGQNINQDFNACKEGMVLILALNLYVYSKPFFPRKISCKIELNDGAKHSADLVDGFFNYLGSENPPKTHYYDVPFEYNMNINRLINANTDNIRVLFFFFENLNIADVNNIDSFEVVFHGRFFNKRTKFTNADCVKAPLIHCFDKTEEKGNDNEIQL